MARHRQSSLSALRTGSLVRAGTRRLRDRFVWPAELADLLGKVPDAELARIAGVCVKTVATERLRRRIAAFASHRRRYEWTPESIALLGSAIDAEVAAALGISHSAVAYKRLLLGIAPFCPLTHERIPAFSWTAERLALLGKMSDQQVATELGTSANSVCRKRRLLKIRPFGATPPRIEWTEERLDLLGRLPDPEVARRCGISLPTVRRKRMQLGFPPWVRPRLVVPTSPRLRQLLLLPSYEVGRRTGLSAKTIAELRRKLGMRAPTPHARRWSVEDLARLGQEPDARIAPDVGLSASRVRSKRQALGIAPFRPRRLWQSDEIALLGTVSDGEIAKRLGRSIKGVMHKRQSLGIARHRRRTAAAGQRRADRSPGISSMPR
jgi:hypothetical protein